MSAPSMTPELKLDLELLNMRQFLEGGGHSRGNEEKELPKHFQVCLLEGTTRTAANLSSFRLGRLFKDLRISTVADCRKKSKRTTSSINF